jgi:hypothetical protein
MALILQVAITIIFAISLHLPLKWLFAGRVTFGRGLKTAIVARACESHNNAGDMQVAGVEDDAPFEKSLPKCKDAGRKVVVFGGDELRRIAECERPPRHRQRSYHTRDSSLKMRKVSSTGCA